MRSYRFFMVMLLGAVFAATQGFAQSMQVASMEARDAPQPVAIALEEAIQIALVNNHVMRSTRLDVDNANAQVREAWGQVMPQLDVQSSYTRNLKSANPFAGSEAGGLFASFG
ncbi:MAG: TolC family protein, partial [Rhodothermales bacterium]